MAKAEGMEGVDTEAVDTEVDMGVDIMEVTGGGMEGEGVIIMGLSEPSVMATVPMPIKAAAIHAIQG
jgi:hypothetical protein